MHVRLSRENIEGFTRAAVFYIYWGFVAFQRPVIEGVLFVFSAPLWAAIVSFSVK